MKNLSYSNLEKNMVRYQDLVTVPVIDNGEHFVVLDKNIKFGYIRGMNDMETMLHGKIYIRKSINNMLVAAQNSLRRLYPFFSLYVTYGYRSPEVQKRKFRETISKISKNEYYPNSLDLYEVVHRYIAVPSVAGHPTGGAIDLVIIDNRISKFLDFGSKIYDFSTKKIYMYFPTISKKAKNNRELLRSIMLNEGFSPFDGEWWHFSYGDKEWAYYYKVKKAIYEQKNKPV